MRLSASLYISGSIKFTRDLSSYLRSRYTWSGTQEYYLYVENRYNELIILKQKCESLNWKSITEYDKDILEQNINDMKKELEYIASTPVPNIRPKNIHCNLSKNLRDLSRRD